MSPRTLQRRLSEHNAIFNEMLDTMRFGAAKSYLAQGNIAATEIAYLLGFAEQSSFNRAFRHSNNPDHRPDHSAGFTRPPIPS